jgi:hypothetical protein
MKERKKEKKNPPNDRNKGSLLVCVFFFPSNSKVPNPCLGSITKGIKNQKHVKKTS